MVSYGCSRKEKSPGGAANTAEARTTEWMKGDTVATTSVPASAKEATTRTERGLALYRERGEHIEHVAPYVYLVPSQDGQRVYRVNYERETCTCPDNQYRGIACVHVYCVGISRAKRRARRGL